MANNKIQFKRTSTSGLLPNTTSSANASFIDAGEFAVNLTDRKVISSNGTATFEVGANLSSLLVTGSATLNAAASVLTVGNSTVNTSINTTSITVGSNVATIGTAVYSVSNGNFGIGTPSPGAKVDAIGSGSVYVRARSTDTTGAAIGYVGAEFAGGSALQIRAGEGYTYLVSTGASDPLLFGTNTTERMRITGVNGNVGINNTSPAHLLSINGTTFLGGTVTITNSAALVANGSNGTSGQVLTSNGTGVYWSTPSGSFSNGTAYTWSAVQTFSASINVTNAAASGNATSGAITVTGGIGVSNNIYTAGRVGFSNATNQSVVYQYYNAGTNSLDTVFG